MENDSERMMMQMMANMMAGKQDEGRSCSSCRIDFFERENAVDNQAEGVFSHAFQRMLRH